MGRFHTVGVDVMWRVSGSEQSGGGAVVVSATLHAWRGARQSASLNTSSTMTGDGSGVLHAYDVRDTTIDPPQLWSLQLTGCIESTPAVWKGRLYFGTRAGLFFAIGVA